MTDHEALIQRLSDWDGVLRVCLDCREETTASQIQDGICRECRDLYSEELDDQ